MSGYSWIEASRRLKMKQEIRRLLSERGLLDKMPEEILEVKTKALKFILELLKNE